MKNLKLFIFVMLFGASIAAAAHAQRSDSIAAVVNGDIITYTDLYDRMDLIIKSSRMPNTNEFKTKLLPQVLTGLITENIQLQEAKRLGLNTNADEIAKGFEELAKQNNLTADQFKTVLKKQNVPISTLEKQIESQLAWGKVIQSEIRPRVILTDSDIDSEVARLKSREGQSEYFVAEIFLPVDESTTEADVKKAADDLSKQLSSDVTKFPAAARQFSQSTTAAQGGIIGWITPDQMDEDTALALRNMTVKTISQPIKNDDGYRILFLREKRTISLSGAGQNQEKMRIKMAVFELPNNESDRKQTISDVEAFRRDVKGCLDIMRLTTKNKAAKLQEFDDVVSNIPTQIIDAVDGINIGEVGTTIESDISLSLPMLCGRQGGADMNAIEMEIENRIGTQRMDVLQRQYLRDLITNAYIERRV